MVQRLKGTKARRLKGSGSIGSKAQRLKGSGLKFTFRDNPDLNEAKAHDPLGALECLESYLNGFTRQDALKAPIGPIGTWLNNPGST